MAFNYTQSDLSDRVDALIQGKIGILRSAENTFNAGVRSFLNKVDLKSLRRKVTLTPNLFNGVFDYAKPGDIKAQAIIDIPAQARRQDGEWMLVPSERFDRGEGSGGYSDQGYSYGNGYNNYEKNTGIMAIDDFNGTGVLKLSSGVDSKSLLISELDAAASGGGDWVAFGDVENIAADNSDYIKGAGSLKWDITAAGGVTAGLQNTGLNSADISDYFGGTSAFFVWFKINSATDLTNMILHFGSDNSNYHSKTITAQSDGTAFVAGWNLLRFDVSSLSDTGTPDDTAMTYAAIYMTKDAGKVSETDYKLDWLILKKGIIHDVKYYGRYGWQNSSGTYIENSSSSSDVLVADTDEFDLIISHIVIMAKKEIGFTKSEIDDDKADLKEAILEYQMRNPSEAKIMMYDSYNFISGDTSEN